MCRTDFRTGDIFCKCDLTKYILLKKRFFHEVVNILNVLDLVLLCLFFFNDREQLPLNQVHSY